MSYICQDCNCHFHSTDQNLSEQKFGQCPFCGGEDIVELPSSDIEVGDLVRLTFSDNGKLSRIEKY